MFRVEEKNMQKQTDQQNADTDTRNRLYDTIAQQPKRKPLKERKKIYNNIIIKTTNQRLTMTSRHNNS